MAGHVPYEYLLTILLYRVIGRIRVTTLHLGVLNGEIDMMDRTQDHLHYVLAKISCPAESGGGICAQLCVCVQRCWDCCV